MPLDREEERERERAERDRERERERAERARERERRREEHRRVRRELHFGRRGFAFDIDIDPDEIARSVSSAFVDMDDDAGETFDEVVEKTFTVEGMPRLRVRNVAGETAVHAGAGDEVHVVARKRVRGGSADRAKRLLENVEVRIEQHGADIYVEPHLYEQERSWRDLFAGKKVRVDLEITVPRECAVDAQTVSGDLSVQGTRGPARVESVSGDVEISDMQGPMRLKSVSGDVECVDYVGVIEGSSVSGDVDVRGRVKQIELHTVSGDISVELDPREGGHENRLKTISGDVDLGLVSTSCLVEFRTASGDLECGLPANVVREGRKDRVIAIGEARARVLVKTVSGDLEIRKAPEGPAEEEPAMPTGEREPEAERADVSASIDPERTEPMTPPVSSRVKELLERVARGEVSVDEAADALDEAKRG